MNVRPEDGLEKKKPVKKKMKEGWSQATKKWRGYGNYHTCDGMWWK